MERKYLEAKAGTTIFASTGMLGKGHPDRMSTLSFYKALPGGRIRLLHPDYYFNIATYSPIFDQKYIYTYAYQEEQSWTSYNRDLSGTSYRQDDYLFAEETFFRVCLKRVDGKDFTDQEAEKINEILEFTSPDRNYCEKTYFADEVRKTVDAIRRKRTAKSLVLGVLADSHYTVNGTWEDTAHNIQAVHQKAGFDGIVHLGDLTDGMVPAAVTKKYAEQVIKDLKQNQIPVYIVQGNHDSNYFYGNPEPLTEYEQYLLYQQHSDPYVNRISSNLYYFVDFQQIALRCIFLTSFDYREKVRYGFSDQELDWLDHTLANTPEGYAILVFSHDAPLAHLDYWADTIRNGDRLMSILQAYHSCKGRKVMAFIHGHTHADYVYLGSAFPIISVGCAKCEYFPDKKPEGAVARKRYLHTVTQDLWDTLIITPSENSIELIRFGAGESRSVRCD